VNATLVNLSSLLDAYGQREVELRVSVAILQGRRILILPQAAPGAYRCGLPSVVLDPGERLHQAGERAGALAGLTVACGRVLVLLESITGARHRLSLVFAASARSVASRGRGEWVPTDRMNRADLDPGLAFGLRAALAPGRRAPVHVVAEPEDAPVSDSLPVAMPTP
jgi:hypothetical protein